MPSRRAPTWAVRRNGQLAPELQPLQIQRSLNGEHLDYAEITVDTKRVPTFSGLDDFSPWEYLGNQIDILAADGSYVHQGTVSWVSPRFNVKECSLAMVSRTEPYQFGLTLFGQLHWHPVINEYFVTDHDLIFNPTIDGKTQGNKHNSKTYRNEQFANQSIAVANEIPIFLNPEAVRTSAARQLYGGRAVVWALSEVLYYLCWMANRQQTFLVNPTLPELQNVVRDSVDLVRNLKIKNGSTLPEALDATLIPLGYHWRVTHRGILTYLEIIRRATGGKLTWLKHQRLKQTLNTNLTNTEACNVRFDISRLRNQIVGKGSKLRVEITAELHRAWPQSLDDTPLEQLELSAVKASENPHMINVWRKWVLNESGDYIGLRPEINGLFTPALLTSLRQQDLLRWFLPSRRKFLPTITTDANITAAIGDVGGLDIEYLDYDGSWKPVKGWGIDLLETECGIYLGGTHLPEELYDQGHYGKIRVTATIEADYRLTYTAAKQPDSPVFGTVESVIDLADDYQHNVILAGSKYADRENNRTTDDSVALRNFTEALRERFDQIDVPGGVVLEGVDHLDYLPGDRVGGIQGKNIYFESKRGSGQYPQIVSVTLDIAEQKTLLQLQRFREFRPS